MDESHTWRQMFERGGTRPRGPERSGSNSPNDPTTRPPSYPLGGYDDGHQPSAEATTPPLSPQDITDEAAMALASMQDTAEYRPWVLQRGTRPVLMLHLRRYDPKSGLWMGWELSYPNLVEVGYTGDRLLSLDFGSRQFMLEGTGLDELARHLQNGNVLMVQEYANSVWQRQAEGASVSAIRRVGG